jgi:hypothetical protein
MRARRHSNLHILDYNNWHLAFSDEVRFFRSLELNVKQTTILFSFNLILKN